MKVDNVNLGYRNQGYPKISTNRVSPHFTGAVSPAKVAPPVSDFIMELLQNKTARAVIKKFQVLKGELGGILITAAGTGLVAPIFIAYNPFVKAKPDATPEEKKEVENTKQYTAMRQPISAVLAALFQAGALGPIDKFLEKMSNDPRYAKNFWTILDQSSLQKESYLKRVIAKEMKKEGTVYENKKAFKAELAKRVEQRQQEQINAMAEKFSQSGKIEIGSRAIDNSTTAEILNKQISSYIDDAKELQRDENGIKYYKNKAAMLMNNEEELKELFKTSKLPEDANELEKYLKTAREGSKSQEVKELIDEILGFAPNVRESKCKRTLERINTIRTDCDGNYTPERYVASMEERNANIQKIIDSLKESQIKNPESATEETIKKTLDDIIQKCHYDYKNTKLHNVLDGSETFRSNLEELKTKVTEDAINGYKKLVENKFKGFSQISKVAIGVCITLPITCTALNWVYPRFMDIFFPNLSGSKKEPAANEQKGGNE